MISQTKICLLTIECRRCNDTSNVVLSCLYSMSLSFLAMRQKETKNVQVSQVAAFFTRKGAKKMRGPGQVAICDECIKLCQEMFTEGVR
jgi:hypothetical protein